MPVTMTTSRRITHVLARSGSDGCLLEDLVHGCPDLTWNQIFLELDQLSRNGEVQLRRRGAGEYVVTAVRETLTSPLFIQGGIYDAHDQTGPTA